MLAGLQASLPASLPGGIPAGSPAGSEFEVIALDKQTTQTELLAISPTVLIFEMGSIQPEDLLAQTQALPDLLLIGVDAESHAVLLTGQAAASITLDQIVQIIHARQFH